MPRAFAIRPHPAVAAVYGTQVEILFGGLADAMRRQALPPIARWLQARGAPGGNRARLLDLGTGTGATPRPSTRCCVASPTISMSPTTPAGSQPTSRRC